MERREALVTEINKESKDTLRRYGRNDVAVSVAYNNVVKQAQQIGKHRVCVDCPFSLVCAYGDMQAVEVIRCICGKLIAHTYESRGGSAWPVVLNASCPRGAFRSIQHASGDRALCRDCHMRKIAELSKNRYTK